MYHSRELRKLLSESLEQVLTKLYPATILRWFYDIGMRQLAQADPTAKPVLEFRGDKAPKKPDLVIIAQRVLRDEVLARRFFAMLPAEHQQLITALTWEPRINLASLEKAYGQTVAILNPDERLRHYYPLVIRPQFAYLCVINNREDYWRYNAPEAKANKENHSVALPDALRKIFKAIVPPPAGFELEPIDELPKKDLLRYSCASFAITDMRLVAEYIAQGHLRYTKAETVAMPSLRAIRGMSTAFEFFEDAQDSFLALLRTRLLVSGLAFASQTERAKLLAAADTDTAAAVRSAFGNLSENAAFLQEELLSHFTAARNRWCKHRSDFIQQFRKFFGRFPAGRWVSWDNMRSYFRLRELTPSLFEPGAGLQANAYRDGNTWSNVISVDGENGFELVSEPLIKGHAFLLAAFGLAEIAYVLPTHPKYHIAHERYLTPFDGLRFLRLTPLGEYVFGQSKTYDGAEVGPARSPILLDETRLLAMCDNPDKLTALALSQFMEPLVPGRYRMTPKSLLAGCGSREALDERLRLFRRVVAAKPPANWEAFFQQTLARIAPFALEPEYVVLKINEGEEIRRLLATDPVLREVVLKVEGLRIAVRRDDLKKLAKRLEHFGYLSPVPQLSR